MDNNTTNRELFFVQYWGQEVLRITTNITEIVGQGWNLKSPHFYLELKHLSAISDEDAMLLAILLGWGEYDNHNSRHILLRKGKEATEELIEGHIGYTQPVIDYLRSKGYLLPFHDLTTEQLIEYGWAKLKTI